MLQLTKWFNTLLEAEVAHHRKTIDKSAPRDLLDLMIVARSDLFRRCLLLIGLLSETTSKRATFETKTSFLCLANCSMLVCGFKVLLLKAVSIGSGTDTSAQTMGWFCALMTHHPAVLSKMQVGTVCWLFGCSSFDHSPCVSQAELDSVLGKRLAEWKDHQSLPYTNAVIKEVHTCM